MADQQIWAAQSDRLGGPFVYDAGGCAETPIFPGFSRLTWRDSADKYATLNGRR